jgi:hypothetical protein
MAQEAVKITVDAAEFVAFAGKTSQLPAKVKTELRKTVKTEGERVRDAVRADVMKAPRTKAKRKMDGNIPSHRGLRQKIADGVSSTTKATEGQAKVGVFVVASAKNLPASQKKLLKRYNKENGWRHPDLATAEKMSNIGKRAARVGGKSGKNLGAAAKTRARNKGKWYPQKGRPYFGKVIGENEAKFGKALEDAMETARKKAGLQ